MCLFLICLFLLRRSSCVQRISLPINRRQMIPITWTALRTARSTLNVLYVSQLSDQFCLRMLLFQNPAQFKLQKAFPTSTMQKSQKSCWISMFLQTTHTHTHTQSLERRDHKVCSALILYIFLNETEHGKEIGAMASSLRRGLQLFKFTKGIYIYDWSGPFAKLRTLGKVWRYRPQNSPFESHLTSVSVSDRLAQCGWEGEE